MITRIEALHYRCLRWVSQPLDRFHVIVGPNASGKTTFLDTVSFLGELLDRGLDAAVSRRTQNFQDLLWQRPEAGSFALAVELRIPDALRSNLRIADCPLVRYEIELGLEKGSREFGIRAERVSFVEGRTENAPRVVFPTRVAEPATLMLPLPGPQSARLVVNKSATGTDTFFPETTAAVAGGWTQALKLGPRRSALAKMPEDESLFPVATWLKNTLTGGVQMLMLDNLELRRASPPGKGPSLQSDGSNLPWVVADLELRHPERLKAWMTHLQTVLPDLEAVRTIERADDKHRYLVLKFSGGLEVPSWMASDGTLRLLALTLLAYLPELQGTLLIEEPENGIHPRAVETLFQSLSSVYRAQILLATHSPLVVGIVEPNQLLCFGRTTEGATDIVLGSEHPALRDWHNEPNLSVLFAAGVLG